MRNPFLVGDKIYLRQIEGKDLNENYQSWFNDSEICMFNSHHRFPNYKENMQEYYNKIIKSKNNLILAIVDKDSDKHIGNISLQNIDYINRSAELAIIIGDKDYWGKGIGKSACKLIINHGYSSLNLNRIFCGTSSENKAMQKLAETIGFKKEGVSRQAIYKSSNYNDVINYGLIRYEYK